MISLPGTPHLAANSCSLYVISTDVGQANPGVLMMTNPTSNLHNPFPSSSAIFIEA